MPLRPLSVAALAISSHAANFDRAVVGTGKLAFPQSWDDGNESWNDGNESDFWRESEEVAEDNASLPSNEGMPGNEYMGANVSVEKLWREYEAWRAEQPIEQFESAEELPHWETWKNEQADLLVNGTNRIKDPRSTEVHVPDLLSAAAYSYRTRTRSSTGNILNRSLEADAEPWIKDMMPIASHACSTEELDQWKNRRDAQRLFSIWDEHLSNSYVFSHKFMTEGICLIKGLTTSDASLPAKPQHASKVLSLIWKKREPICETENDRFQYIRPDVFYVSGPLASHGKERLLGMVWPPNDKCTSGQKCPVVVFFSGIGEHSHDMQHVNFDAEELKKGFENLHKWALLRYVEHDRKCFNSLGSVLVMPELNGHETWVTHGRDLMTYFIIPVLDGLKRDHGSKVDMDRVSVVGYSEGAFGAMQAAVQYPDRFTISVAASLSAPHTWWDSIPINIKATTSQQKLRSVILAWGEYDGEGDQPTNLDRALTWLQNAGVLEHATLLTQFHAGLGHQDLWEHVFNRWSAFHEVIWRGNYQKDYMMMSQR